MLMTMIMFLMITKASKSPKVYSEIIRDRAGKPEHTEPSEALWF
jgi:hypothetical protein